MEGGSRGGEARRGGREGGGAGSGPGAWPEREKHRFMQNLASSSVSFRFSARSPNGPMEHTQRQTAHDEPRNRCAHLVEQAMPHTRSRNCGLSGLPTCRAGTARDGASSKLSKACARREVWVVSDGLPALDSWPTLSPPTKPAAHLATSDQVHPASKTFPRDATVCDSKV